MTCFQRTTGSIARTVSNQVQRIVELRSSIGTRATIEYALQQRSLRLLDGLRFSVTGKLISLHTRGREHPIHARYGSSDLDVFEQIFVQQEYRALQDIANVNFIVDCGAYVGYSGIYLLDAFPDAHLMAIEQDEANFLLLRRNLGYYGSRITLLRSAIWSHRTPLVISRGEYRDGRQWAIRVREGLPSEAASVIATDMETLLDQCPYPCVDILKMDIETAEAVVFSRNCVGWLNRVRNIAIELHDKECEEIFFRSLRGYRYDLSRSGELTICKNIVRDERVV